MTTVRDMEQSRGGSMDAVLEQIEALRLDARELAQDLTAVQFNWRPSPVRWSIGQCLQHLTLTVQLYPEKIEAMIREARERQARRARPYREGPFTRWFIRSMEPPPGLRIRTMRKVEPAPALEPERVLRDFDAAHARLAELAVAAAGVDPQQGRTNSPFVPLLRFTLGQVFLLNLAHGRRHLWQAWRVREYPGFPSA